MRLFRVSLVLATVLLGLAAASAADAGGFNRFGWRAVPLYLVPY